MAFTFSQSSNPNKLFMLEWSAIAGNRWDGNYNSPSRLLFYSNLREKSLKRIRDVIAEGSYGILPPGDSYSNKKPVRLVRATDMKKDLSIDYSSTVFVDQDHYDNNPRCRLQKNDILLAVKGATIASGKCVSFIDTDVSNTIFNGSVFRIRSLPSVRPKFLAYMLDLDLSKNQMKLSLVSNNAVDYLDSNTIRHLLVYLPSESEQDLVVRRLDQAYDSKRRKEDEARRLFDSFLAIMESIVKSNLPLLNHQKTQFIFWSRIEGPINPDRYALDLSPLIDDGWKPMSEFGKVIHQSISLPNSSEDTIDYDLIRIDDLPNYPQNAIVRTESSTDLKGSYQQAEPGDVLIARLGPSIENAKFIIAPDSSNKIICSNEFIRFRCNENVNPFFLIGMLRTAYFRRLMLTKARGAVPSRRRLSRLDFIQIAFPSISTIHQNEIADRYIKAIDKAKQLIVEAEDIIRIAKEEVEQLILGG